MQALLIQNAQQLNGSYNFTNRQNFGGFVAYLKLVISLYQQLFFQRNLFTKTELAKVVIYSLVKTPYWLFLKPFASLVQVETNYKTNYQFTFIDNVIKEKDKKFTKDSKKISFYFLSIRLFALTTGLKPKDKNMLFQKIVFN